MLTAQADGFILRQSAGRNRNPAHQDVLARALLLLFLAIPAFGLDPHKAITQFVHTAWTGRDGAPSSIQSLAQTTDGYLWLGSASGLFRFDGLRFARFEAPPGENFPD